MVLIRSVKVARSLSNARSQTSSVLASRSAKSQQKRVGGGTYMKVASLMVDKSMLGEGMLIDGTALVNCSCENTAL